MQQKILISGANGFLAHAVISHLPADWQATALVRGGTVSPLGTRMATFDSIATLEGSGTEFNTIFHLAAAIPANHNMVSPALLTTNIELVLKLVLRYPDARHVFASSVAIFGVPQALPLTINSAPLAPSRYGLSKLAGECVVRQSSSHAAIRFSSIIGPGMKQGSFIPTAVAGARSGCIRLRGDGSRLQNYLDIDDAAKMCIHAATMESSFVCLGVGQSSYSNAEVAELLAKLTGASIVKEGVDASPSYVYAQDSRLDLAGQTHNLEETLTRMLNS